MFKDDFKYYKSKNPPPSFASIINFNVSEYLITNPVMQVTPNDVPENFFGLKTVKEWKILELTERPGLIIINNPFTSLGQRYWITRSLKDYSNKPNKTNLDVHNIIPENEEWWHYSQNEINRNILKKLRWATLGYHHNWDTKVYSNDMMDVFPNDLKLLCNFITNALGFKNFEAQAAIVNYYNMDSTLSGHTDHSEQNLQAPLLSLSFGQTAIFLIGGKSIDVKPVAIFLHSGDIVIMSKDSRLSYHGVPKIIFDDNECWNTAYEKWNDSNENIVEQNLGICYDEKLWKPFNEYLKFSRININVRQVLNEGQTNLC